MKNNSVFMLLLVILAMSIAVLGYTIYMYQDLTNYDMDIARSPRYYYEVLDKTDSVEYNLYRTTKDLAKQVIARVDTNSNIIEVETTTYFKNRLEALKTTGQLAKKYGNCFVVTSISKGNQTIEKFKEQCIEESIHKKYTTLDSYR